MQIKNVCLRQAQAIYRGMLDSVFPPLCYSCFSHLESHEKELNICTPCASSIKIHSSLFCPICKSRVPIRTFVHDLYIRSSPPCHRQAGFLLAPSSDFDIPAVKELIHTFKYKKIEQAILPITELLIKPYLQKVFVNSLIRLFEKNSLFGEVIIIPIPLHKQKLRSRGFNQSALIAKSLAKCLSEVRPPWEAEPLRVANVIVRVKYTKSQAETKSKEARLANVQGCFVINPSKLSTFPPKADPPLADNLQLTTFVLVDDVTTSGATMAEAVKTLKRAGAKRILAFVLAKA